MCIYSMLNTTYLYVSLKNSLNKVLIAVLYIKFPNFPCPFPPHCSSFPFQYCLGCFLPCKCIMCP